MFVQRLDLQDPCQIFKFSFWFVALRNRAKDLSLQASFAGRTALAVESDAVGSLPECFAVASSGRISALARKLCLRANSLVLRQ